jgi:putative redox protein
MASKLVHLRWNPEEEFILRDDAAHQIVMKQPRGVSPSDLLPMALIGCTSYDVVEILRKQRQDVRELNISAESVQDEDPPWRFRKIHIRYQVVGKSIDPEKIRRAIQISEEKYCAVYATLKDALEITHEFEVIEPEG